VVAEGYVSKPDAVSGGGARRAEYTRGGVALDKLNIDDIMPNSVLAQDVFGQIDNTSLPLLRKGSIISAEYLYKLKERNINYLYVKRKISGILLSEPGTNPHARFSIPYEKSKSSVSPIVRKDAVKSLRALHIVSQGSDAQATANAVNHLCDVLTKIVDGLHTSKTVNIHQLQSVDEYIYHHTLSVVVISLAIGQGLGLGKTTLFNIAQCALMHDVGKYLTPPEVLNKKELLNESELQTVKRHAVTGFEYMKKSDMLTETHRQAIVLHHEKIDGTGYPLGMKGEKIPLWSRIIAVADVYDAMTSRRPYRDALSPSEAYEYIQGLAYYSFDFDIVRAFINKMEFYPVGCIIELSSGLGFAIVLEALNKLRPRVKRLDVDSEIDLCDIRYLNVTIKRIVPYEEALGRK